MSDFFYTSVELFSTQPHIFVRGYLDGEQFFTKVSDFSPVLYRETDDANAEFHGIHGEPLRPVFFDGVNEMYRELSASREIVGKDYYGNEIAIFSYINEIWPEDTIDYDPELIRIASFDIEVESRNGFPEPDKATQPILSWSIEYRGKVFVGGLKDFDDSYDTNITYYKCADERELIRKFSSIMKEISPDIITGWNIDGFDIPYLIHRCENLFGNFYALTDISPWGLINKYKSNKYGEVIMYRFVGVNNLDYMSLYKKLTQQGRESYSLDSIAQEELGEAKLDYTAYNSLHELYDNDYETYIKYNIHDSKLVTMLENKLKYIQLTLATIYRAKVNIQDIFSQVRMWEAMISNYLLKKKIIVPPKKFGDKSEQYIGAWVKTPQNGLHEWVVSFDLDSLYPSLIEQFNISPDTIYDQEKSDLTVDEMLDLDKVRNDDIVKRAVQDNRAVAANGWTFDKSKKGFLPEIITELKKTRFEYKEKMKDAKNELEEIKQEMKRRGMKND